MTFFCSLLGVFDPLRSVVSFANSCGYLFLLPYISSVVIMISGFFFNRGQNNDMPKYSLRKLFFGKISFWEDFAHAM